MGKCVDKGYHPYVEITVCDECVHHDMCETGGYLEENYCHDRCVGTPEQFAAWKRAADEGRLVELPCKVGDTVYRICPKCNENHDGNCKNCAWGSAIFQNGCNVFGLWENGEYPADKCTIVPYKATWNFMKIVREYIGKKIFLTRKAAEAALEAQEGK